MGEAVSSSTLAVQRALRARLIGSAPLRAIVPPDHVLDRNARPAPDPSIILGESQWVEEGEDLGRSRVRIYSTLHIWKRETGLEGVQEIAGLVRRAMREPDRLDLGQSDMAAIDNRITSIRLLRDPDGEWGHGVLTIETIVAETWALS
jgi:hypothetical protein